LLHVESQDIALEKIEALTQSKELQNIFPEIFEDGSLNLEKLKTILFDYKAPKTEHYSFSWNGKQECYKIIKEKSSATLKRDEDEEIPKGNNVFIEGDNLEVLKLLQNAYHKQIKMIYIDPPYNKNKDFIYKDSWSDSMINYLMQTDQLREEGYTSTKTQSSGRRHTNWLNMMYPRLWLSRNLLKDDGVIFVSIDDDEVHNLRKIMDEIYGEDNFVAQIVWERAFSPKNDAKYFSENHDYILVYAKKIEYFKIEKLKRSDESTKRYKNLDNDERGDWLSGDLTVKTYSEKYDYPIQTPSGDIINPTKGRCWGVSKDKFQELVADNRIWFGNEGNNVPRLKRFLSEVQEGMVPTTLWKHTEVGHNQEGRQELKELFDGKGFFDGPKPIRLIKRILELSNTKNNDLILDFFAGSGTTAHAVMAQNREDGGNRRYIAVQLPEATDEKSEAYKAGYSKISAITKERIKRAMKKLDYKEGFKSYYLDTSNFQIFEEVKKQPGMSFEAIEKQLRMSMFHENILTQGAKELDIVYEIGLKNGFSLSADYEVFEKEPYRFVKLFETERAFYFCFNKNIQGDIINALPQNAKLICYDKALNDSTKLNLRENLELETL